MTAALERPFRVLIADDHAPTRTWVREALETAGWLVVAEAADARAAVEAAASAVLDVAVLDIVMPGGGIAAADAITRAHPDVKVVMLTSSRDDEHLFDALRAGASGYLLKDIDPRRLPSALRGVLEGEAALPRWLTLKVLQHLRDQPPRRRGVRSRPQAARLTDREAEVLELMVDGGSTDEIAASLFVAPVTVRTHIRAVLRKLRVQDRDAAIAIFRPEES